MTVTKREPKNSAHMKKKNDDYELAKFKIKINHDIGII